MQPEEITSLFDRQASTYDDQWHRLSPINSALHLLAEAVFSELSPTAHILCVGAGTGAEILHLARSFPRWQFTAVEPSIPMLEEFQRKAEAQDISSRCNFHGGYLESLPRGEKFDAATSFLVSQFILEPEARSSFFQEIANRLHPGGLLLSSDLAGDLTTTESQGLLEVWFKLMSGNGVSDEGVQKMKQAYSKDVAVLPPADIREIITRGGFDSPVPFFQAGLIHAWYAKRSPGQA